MRLILIALLLSGCASRAAQENLLLRAEVQDLSARVGALERDMVALTGSSTADPEREAAAMQIAIQARAAMDSYNMELARDLVEELVRDFPDTEIGQAATGVAENLSVIGAPAGELDVERWFQGETTYDPERTTLVVFFETWCPHCKNEAPKLQERYADLHDQGLDVIGLTNMSRGTTQEQLDSFIATADIAFPVAQDSGIMATRYRVQGIPSAVLLRGGKVIWSGHPAEMTSDVLEGFLPPVGP